VAAQFQRGSAFVFLAPLTVAQHGTRPGIPSAAKRRIRLQRERQHLFHPLRKLTALGQKENRSASVGKQPASANQPTEVRLPLGSASQVTTSNWNHPRAERENGATNNSLISRCSDKDDSALCRVVQSRLQFAFAFV
jgi:hypothetical protein